LPPIKNQKQTNLCWAFSSLSAVELMLGKLNGGIFDFSEANAAEKLSKTAQGFNRGILDAGNFSMSMAYMTSPTGPIEEKDDPFDSIFSNKKSVEASAVTNVMAYEQLPYNISMMKAAIQQYGSIISAMFVTNDTASDFYNPKTGAYYMADAKKSPNHQIQLIGWDNSYPAANFSTKPPIDGAWIVKNSWGPTSGDNGYYYISYADNTLAKSLNVVTKLENSSSGKLYSHDPYGSIGAINFNSTEAWSAGSFNVDGTSEKLTAVAFHSPNANISYEIWYSPTGNFGDKQKLKSGMAKNPGYLTVKLDNPVDITGAAFTVMVKFTASNVVNLSLQKNLPGYLENATASEGMTFASRDGSQWSDVAGKMKDAALCVRAWTTSSGSGSAQAAVAKPAASAQPQANSQPQANAQLQASEQPAANAQSKTAAQAPEASGKSEEASKQPKSQPAASGQVTHASAAEQVVAKLGLGSSADASKTLEALGCYASIKDYSDGKAMTREEFAYVLAKALKLPSSGGKTLSDVGGSFAKSAITALYSKKIIAPNADGTFNPSGPLLSVDMEKWLANAAAYKAQQ
jgi:C1A family cysteine protease